MTTNSVSIRKFLLGLKDHTIDPHSSPISPEQGETAISPIKVYRAFDLDMEDKPEGKGSSGRPASILVVRPLPPEAQRHGESPLDYARVIQDDTPQAPIQSAESWHWRAQWQTRLRVMEGLGFPPDPGTVQPSELLYLYNDLTRVSREREIGEILAAHLLLLYGIVPNQLVDLKFTDGLPPDDESGWHLDPATWTLYLPFPALGYVNADLASRGPFRPGGRWIILPLIRWTQLLGMKYRTALEGAGLWPPQPLSPFFFSLREGKPRPLTVRDLNQWLTLRYRWLTLRYRYIRLTATRLSQVTRRWGVFAGRQRIEAALASGRFGFEVHASCAYLNISASQLAKRVISMAAEVYKLVQAEILAVGYLSAELVQPALWELPEDHGERFGSLVVPEVGPLRDRIAALRRQLRPVSRQTPLPSLQRAWNRYVLHEWLRFLWATALRPVKDPLLTRSSFRSQPPWAIVADKDSPRWEETRLVPLTLESVSLLERLAETGKEVRQAGRGWRGFDESKLHPEHIFFWIDSRRRALPLSAGAAEDILREEELAWPYPLNAGRHFFLTRAWEEEILGLIDPFVGHLHEGQEPWGRYSWAPLESHSKSFRDHSRRILKEVGFEDPGPFFS